MNASKYILTLILLVTSFNVQGQKATADRRFDDFDFFKAIPLYLKYLKRNPSDQEARENLAYSYRMIKDYANAESWYGQVCKARTVAPENRLYYAEALIGNGKHEKAIPQLELYLEQRDWDIVAKNMLESAQNQEQYYEDSTLHYVRPSNINTAGPEFGPVIYKNTVIFASPSDRAKVVYNWTGDKFLDLWVAPYSGNYKLGDPVPLVGNVNSRYHEGGATFTPDGNEMYFTRNNYYRGKVRKDENRVVRLKAYKAELIGGKWTNIQEFPFNSDEYSVGHPCMNTEGNIIYFVSDMPGGAGGTDIWMTKKKGEDWMDPVNMGDKINSPGDEMFPWISSNGVMYFSSNGKGGLGGLDIFRVTSMGTDLEQVENMGYPVNSHQDDFSLVVDERTGQGFFTSNRRGGEGDDDIYSVRQKQVVEGLVLDAENGEPIPDARVEAFNARGMVAVAFANDEGRFKIGLDRNGTYRAVGDAEAYLESTITISTLSFDPKVPVEALIKLNRDMDCEAPFALEGVIKTMADDSTFNESEDFSDATVRVMPKEFTILPDENGQFALSLQPEMDYDIRIEKPGYMDRTTFVSTKGMDPGTLTMEAILAGLSEDTTMYKIFYDYDDSRIRSYAYKELDKVIDYMNRNPEVKIRLVSHADARGTTYYNDRLSKDRTLAAYEYLRMEGIDKDRLELVWVGERKPANDCGDGMPCSEEDYQVNRRTDIEYGGTNPLPPKLELPDPIEFNLGESDDDGDDSTGVKDTKFERSDDEGKITKSERGDGDGEKPFKHDRNDAPAPDSLDPATKEMAPANEVVKEEEDNDTDSTEVIKDEAEKVIPDMEVVEDETPKDTEVETPEETPDTEIVKDEEPKDEEPEVETPEKTPETEVVKEEAPKEEDTEVEKLEKTPDVEVVEEEIKSIETPEKTPDPEAEKTLPETEVVKEEVDPTEAIEKVVEETIDELETPVDTTSRTINIIVPPQED